MPKLSGNHHGIAKCSYYLQVFDFVEWRNCDRSKQFCIVETKMQRINGNKNEFHEIFCSMMNFGCDKFNVKFD